MDLPFSAYLSFLDRRKLIIFDLIYNYIKLLVTILTKYHY